MCFTLSCCSMFLSILSLAAVAGLYVKVFVFNWCNIFFFYKMEDLLRKTIYEIYKVNLFIYPTYKYSDEKSSTTLMQRKI
jgi:hypothetical protein